MSKLIFKRRDCEVHMEYQSKDVAYIREQCTQFVKTWPDDREPAQRAPRTPREARHKKAPAYDTQQALLVILDHLTDKGSPSSVSYIARECDMPKSVVQRALRVGAEDGTLALRPSQFDAPTKGLSPMQGICLPEWAPEFEPDFDASLLMQALYPDDPRPISDLQASLQWSKPRMHHAMKALLANDLGKITEDKKALYL